jgi:class 3 adenylate cyclase/predicted ATPase
MQQISDWLAELGLGRYAKIFEENGIDFGVLPDLTDQDLEKLGVLLGHRRKILRAIADLKGIEKSPVAVAAPAVPLPPDSAERRQITVMFSDLVGSTALSTMMDPEDLREVVSAYHKCVADVVRRFGGFVAQYLGDGVLVYFGYPQAHEHDTERAVRAGLEVITAVSALKAHAALQTRVGIATGLVVVGDLLGSEESYGRGIVGETPNLAARLQSIAEPDMVVIAESTRMLLGNLFELADLGARELKGIGGPVRAWAALRPSVVESRFEALHADGLTALIDRHEESELLLRRWSRAKGGEGQVALLSGEAGIGKSRLTAALLERLAGEPHVRVRCFCSPQHTDSAFYPIIGQMERAAGLKHDDTAHARRDKLEAMLAQTSTPGHDVGLFAEMLSLPIDGRYPALELTPQQHRQRTLEALVSQIEALARRDPVLMIFEDVHWIDPTSMEVLARVVDRIAKLRVFLIVTSRPEFEPPWIGQPHVTVLTINRLAQRDVDAMIDRVGGGKRIPASIRQDIIERTDGIPLFVEEMTKAVLEAESEIESRRTLVGAPSPAAAVPASLHASLMARLDRLGPAKEVAQIGAAIGREFSRALLSAVVRRPEATIGPALAGLVAAGLLFRQGLPPHESYVFKHALVQDAAYGTLLREPRRTFHARIAESLEREFPELAENQPELLARHCTEAGLIEKAARLWAKAGLRSLARSALAEAAEQLTRALAQIATLPETAALRREQIKLQVALITPLIHTKGYAAPETKAAVERAHVLIEQAQVLGEPPEDPLALFSVLFGSWTAANAAFNGDVVLALAAQFMALAEKQGATGPLMDGHRMMGISLLFTGDIADGRAHLDRAIALYDPMQERPVGLDARVASLVRRAWALWLLGYAEAALADTNDALTDARRIGEATNLLFALPHALLIHILRGNYAAANAAAAELGALADEKGSRFWKSCGTSMQGCLFAVTGRASDAVHTITSGIAAWRATGATIWLPVYLSYLTRAYAECGKVDDAWRCIGEAITAVETTKERWWEAEVNRVAGEVALISGRKDSAEAYFSRALEVAVAQQAKAFELREAMSMARLWRDQGRPHEARDVLLPVYGWFTEGFDTLDLREAKALLNALAS